MSGAAILVTGGAGFIGSNIADRLAGEGRDVIVYDALTRAGVERNLAWLQRNHGARIAFVHADIRDRDALAAAVRDAEAVFHMAAQVAVTTSLDDPRDDLEINILGTFNLLEAVRAAGGARPVIFASTNKVYGDLADLAYEPTAAGHLPVDPAIRAHGIGEDRPLDFHTPYGVSKGAADQYVLDYARSYGMPAAVLRMSCIYGQRQMGTEDQGWVAHFLIRALEGKPITLYGDGHQVRDILDVGDAVDAYLRTWQRIDRVAGRAFNLGGGAANAVSLRVLLDHIGRLVGRPPELGFADWRAGDQRYFVADTRAAETALGLAPKRGWRDGVAALAQWLAEERGLPIAGLAPARQDGFVSLRVLLTTDAIGGVWTYTLELAEALGQAGVATVIATLGPPINDDQRGDVGQLPHAALVETGLPIDWTCDDPAPVLAAGTVIARLAADQGVDLIQHNLPALAAVRGAVPSLAVVHGCVATWWVAARPGQPMSADLAWHHGLMADGLRAVDLVVAPSAAYAAQVARTYRLPSQPVVVPNGRRAPDPAATEPAEPARHAFTAGRLWDAVKNTPFLDAVAARLAFPFAAAGAVTAPHGERVATGSLQLLGQLGGGALAGRLERRPIFVSAALFEPFGLAVLEAAQHGCPLVLSDIATFRELWDGAALFLPLDGDADAWAAAITALADAPDRGAALGDAARQRADRYTPQATGATMRELYDRILTARSARAAA